MNWTDMLTSQAKMAYQAARGLVEMVDDDQLDWAPSSGDNWLDAGQLCLHVSNACGNTARGFVTGAWDEGDHGISPDWKPGEGEMMPPASAYLRFDREEALAALAADEETFFKTLAEAGEARLDGDRLTAPWGGPELTLGEHLLTCVQHLNTHKAQLFYYLKLMGKPVNTMSLWAM